MPGVLPSTLTARLQKVQSFQETVWGTTGLATAKWMGLAPYPTFTPMIKSVGYDEDRGGLQESYNSNVLQLGGGWAINWQYASFEDINFALQTVIKAVSPSGGNPYVYTYPAPTTAVNALLPYTLEWGYDVGGGQYAGCLGQKLTIKGEAKKQWEVSVDGFFKTYNPNAAVNIVSSTDATPIVITTASDPYVTGQSVIIAGHLTNTNANGTWTITRTGAGTYSLTGSTGTGGGAGGATGTITKTLTPAIADRTVNAIIFPGTTLAIDNAGGTIGTTAFANVFLGFEFTYENSVLPIWTGDSLNPQVYAYDRLKASLKLKLLYNAQVKAMVDTQLKGGGGILVQIKKTQSANVAEIDFAGILTTDPPRYPMESGAEYIELSLSGQYDTGAFANSAQVIVTNSIANLP